VPIVVGQDNGNRLKFGFGLPLNRVFDKTPESLETLSHGFAQTVKCL
jgi:hypothetical protein